MRRRRENLHDLLHRTRPVQVFADLQRLVHAQGVLGLNAPERILDRLQPLQVSPLSLTQVRLSKLALLLGDKYILDQYGRSSNTYAKAAMNKIRGIIKDNPESAQNVLKIMKGHLKDMAKEFLDKYFETYKK